MKFLSHAFCLKFSTLFRFIRVFKAAQNVESCFVSHAKVVNFGLIISDGHDKPFCIKAIIDKFKKAVGNTENR